MSSKKTETEEETVADGTDDTVAAAEEETVAAGTDDTVAAAEEETVAAGTDDTVAAADETPEDAGDDDETVTASVVDADAIEDADATENTEDAADQAGVARRRIDWRRVVAFGLLPALALVLALGAGFLKWQDNSVRDNEVAAMTSVQAAKDSTIALLSYEPGTVEQQLGAARDLLTGDFRDDYTSLTNDVVIPGAKEQQISAVASVPAAASVSADPNHAVVLLFVNQTVTVGRDVPTDTASSVRVTLDKVDGRWLISEFEPV